jgi:hypothetical protein
MTSPKNWLLFLLFKTNQKSFLTLPRSSCPFCGNPFLQLSFVCEANMKNFSLKTEEMWSINSRSIRYLIYVLLKCPCVLITGV